MGEKTYRAHYHCIYFNLNLPKNDLTFYKVDNGNLYFNSNVLNQVWKKGFVVVGALDIGSACYVARYCDKKLNRSEDEKKAFLDYGLQPEFSNMSRRPGIGAAYMDKIIDNLKNDIFTLTYKNNTFSIPIYYSKKIKEIVPPDILKKLEDRNRLLINTKFNNDMFLSDLLATDPQNYYLLTDKLKKSCKSVRDNIKY